MTDERPQAADFEPDRDERTPRHVPEGGPEHAGARAKAPASVRIDRRGWLRGAAMLTVGALGARAAPAQDAASSSAPETAASGALAAASGGTDTSAQLESQTRRVLRWAGPAPADWVRPRAGVDHNVVIVGGGQSGVAIAYGLRRKGVGGVEVVDQAEPGQAGIWRNIARMDQLRTPKTMPGPEGDNVALGFRAWYETLNGPEAFDGLDRIPTLAWADYLSWFQQTTGTNVRYGTRLVEIEPEGDVLRLHLESDGAVRIETARKLVLATGYAGAGGPNVPDFMRALPGDVWTHTTGRIPVEALGGKVVGVIGAGSNAFDAAAIALEAGAAEVHLFSRRSSIAYQGVPPQAASRPRPQPAPQPVDRGYPNVLELACELPDVLRWRNFVLRERSIASVPLDSLDRAMAFDNVRIHLDTSLADVELAQNGQVRARAGRDTMRFDYLIAATGYRIDLGAQGELARIDDLIARWGDRYAPAPGEEDAGAAAHPYLGTGFEFLPRGEAGADFLRNIHCFNLAAALSFGIPVGDVPSMVDHPRLVTAIARDLYLESVDMAAHERYFNMPAAAPQDPSPYERAVVGRVREVA
jgi:cation diffusion facilitator CzcD-associated flavoprotein CzcO